MGYNTVAVLYNDHTHIIRDSGPVGKRIADAMQSWSIRKRDHLATHFGCGQVISQDHADYPQVVVVGRNTGRPLHECNDLDFYALDQLSDALIRHGYTVKPPKKKAKSDA
jgi:hypothetical protein